MEGLKVENKRRRLQYICLGEMVQKMVQEEGFVKVEVESDRSISFGVEWFGFKFCFCFLEL